MTTWHHTLIVSICAIELMGCAGNQTSPSIDSIRPKTFDGGRSGPPLPLGDVATMRAQMPRDKVQFAIGYHFSNLENKIIDALPIASENIPSGECVHNPSPKFEDVDAQKAWNVNYSWILNAWAMRYHGVRAGWRTGQVTDFHGPTAILGNAANVDLIKDNNTRFCMDIEYSIKLWQRINGRKDSGVLSKIDVDSLSVIVDKIDSRFLAIKSGKPASRVKMNKYKPIHENGETIPPCSLARFHFETSLRTGNPRDQVAAKLNSAVFKQHYQRRMALVGWAKANYYLFPENCINSRYTTQKFQEAVSGAKNEMLSDDNYSKLDGDKYYYDPPEEINSFGRGLSIAIMKTGVSGSTFHGMTKSEGYGNLKIGQSTYDIHQRSDSLQFVNAIDLGVKKLSRAAGFVPTTDETTNQKSSKKNKSDLSMKIVIDMASHPKVNSNFISAEGTAEFIIYNESTGKPVWRKLISYQENRKILASSYSFSNDLDDFDTDYLYENLYSAVMMDVESAFTSNEINSSLVKSGVLK